MAKEISKNSLSVFEQIKNIDENGNEFWLARQLAKALDYTDFRNFTGVIEKAAEACKNSGYDIAEHIVEANEVLVAFKRFGPKKGVFIETINGILLEADCGPCYKLDEATHYCIITNPEE